MKKKKVVAVAAAALIAATTVGALAGCGNGGGTGGDGEKVTINVLLLANESEDDFYADYLKKMAKTISKEMGEETGSQPNITIKYQGYEEGDYYTELRAAGSQGNLPDIFYIRPNEILQFKDQIANLQSFAEKQTDVDLDAIYDTALNMYRYNPTTGALGNASDDLYAFPKDLSTQQLGYNKKLLQTVERYIKDANYKLPYDADFDGYTWEEYKEVCRIAAEHLDSKKNQAACDIPSLEILAKSFSTNKNADVSPLIDMTGGRANAQIQSFEKDSPIYKAIEYQADLVACGAANYKGATYADMVAGRVCFYGAMGSWEVKDYNEQLGEGNWGVMPWPTVTKGDTQWQGLITSAGYVVSKACDEATTTDEEGNTIPSVKGEVAKRLAISFMRGQTQDELMEGQISLPLIKDKADYYVKPEQDDLYSPSTRGVFIDVISGKHGFFPAKYSTYDADWLDPLTRKEGALESIWNAGSNAKTKFAETNWTSLQTQMQQLYDASKNR